VAVIELQADSDQLHVPYGKSFNWKSTIAVAPSLWSSTLVVL
jgi:hypothetical protein